MRNLIIAILQIIKALLFLAMVLSLCSCDLRYGIIESSFILSPESRLPKWLTLPTGYSRDKVRIEILVYTHPIKENIICIVYGPPPEQRILIEYVGTKRYPTDMQKRGRSTYPRYIVIKVNGIEEVFEQRQSDNLLYVSDAPIK